MSLDFIKKTETGKTKIVLLTLPAGRWEQFDVLHKAAQEKMPGITHDMIVSTWVADMIDRAAVTPSSPPSVEADRQQLNAVNPS